MRPFRKAVEIFGETWSPELCGWILPDGTMLNFSYQGYQRDREHRDISEVFYELDIEYDGGTDAMIKFERMGAIRFSMYGSGCNVTLNTYQDLTWRQWEVIREACDGHEVAYDIYNDNDSRVRSEIVDLAQYGWIHELQKALEDAKEEEREQKSKLQRRRECVA